ncbi:hypothetical protein MHYP_G00251580 [Metynnis hypsauchen]
MIPAPVRISPDPETRRSEAFRCRQEGWELTRLGRRRVCRDESLQQVTPDLWTGVPANTAMVSFAIGHFSGLEKGEDYGMSRVWV